MEGFLLGHSIIISQKLQNDPLPTTQIRIVNIEAITQQHARQPSVWITFTNYTNLDEPNNNRFRNAVAHAIKLS